MAEGIQFNSNSSESYAADTEQEDKKTKRKRRRKGAGNLGALVSSESKSAETPETAKRNKAKKAPKGLFELAEQTDEQIKQAADIPRQPDKAAYEAVASRELGPDEFNGGEVIINLRGAAGETQPMAETEPKSSSESTVEEAVESTEPEAERSVPEALPTMPTAEVATEDDESPEDDGAQPTPTTTTPSRPVAVPSAQTASGSRGGGNRPPTPTPSSTPSGGNIPPAVPYLYQQRAAQQNANTLPSIQTAAAPESAVDNQRAVDDAEYYGRQKGRSEGFWTGALLVGGYEHFKHRRRERRMKKEFARERETHEKTVEDMRWDAIRKEQTEKWRAAEAAKFSKTETVAGGAKQEQAPSKTKSVELVPDGSEQELQIPEGHHVERSAWHSVEVDERGHTVEDSAINYGHEYYKERAKEAAPVDKAQLKNITGGVALTAAAMNDIDDADESEEAVLSRQNREYAARGETGDGKKKDKAGSPFSPSADSPMSLLPWVIALVVLGLILWALS